MTAAYTWSHEKPLSAVSSRWRAEDRLFDKCRSSPTLRKLAERSSRLAPLVRGETLADRMSSSMRWEGGIKDGPPCNRPAHPGRCRRAYRQDALTHQGTELCKRQSADRLNN